LRFFEDLLLLSLLIFWQLLDRRRFLILCNKYGNIGNQLYMTCFLIHWARVYNALTFNFGLIGNEHYFKNTKQNIFLKYPFKRSLFSFSRLKYIISKSIDRISLRLPEDNTLPKLLPLRRIEITSDSKLMDITFTFFRTQH